MNRLIRIGTVSAASAVLALGLASCSSGEEEKPEKKDTALGCDDLKKQVDANAPDETTPVHDFDVDSVTKLSEWMTENGSKFEDKALGKAVVQFGEIAPTVIADELDEGEATPEDYDKLNMANKEIGSTCSDTGFVEPSEDENGEQGDQNGNDQDDQGSQKDTPDQGDKSKQGN